MTPGISLRILEKRFEQLSRSEFSDPGFKDFVDRTTSAIRHVILNDEYYSPDVLRAFVSLIWDVSPFLTGSKRSDAPHEVQYVLRKALNEWISEPALISSASHDDFQFYLNGAVELWQFIDAALDRFDSQEYRPLVVRMGFPEAFRHRPVFCAPLFHELGHYVDLHHRISEASMLLLPVGPAPGSTDPAAWEKATLSHRREFFADLFATAYCGETSPASLMVLAAGDPDSSSHPSTARRTNTMRAFLDGTSDPHLDIVQATLAALGLSSLTRRYDPPNVARAYDDALTIRIVSKEQLFGIFISAWDYLFSQMTARNAPWIDGAATDSEIEITVNDLTEKSIRDFEVTERWDNVAPHP